MVVPGFYETRKKCGQKSNSLVTEVQKPVRKECRNQANQTSPTVEEEAINSEAEITEPINAPEFSMSETVEGLTESNSGNNGENNCENNGEFNGNNGIPLEDQILEIDSELNGFEISENTERGEAAKNKEVHVENPNIDALNKLPVSLESGLDASVGHVEKGMEAGAGHEEIVNSKNAEPNREREPEVQGGVSSREGKEGLVKQRTWTRVARLAQKGDDRAKAEATGKGSAKVVSPHALGLEGAQVAVLINPNTHTWNINLLNQHFLSFEENRIKAIPLCWTDQRDHVIWPDSQNGEYT
nr:hypothetical protein CFP56_38440 [Quercus suber]